MQATVRAIRLHPRSDAFRLRGRAEKASAAPSGNAS